MNAGRLSRRGMGLYVTLAAAAAAAVALIPGPAQGRGPGVAYQPGDIIVADANHGAVKNVDPVTGVSTPVSSGGSLNFPADVTFASDGDALVVDRDAFGGSGGIIRLDSVTGAQSTVSNNNISQAAGGKELFGNPIALDRKGGSVYVVDFHRPHKVIKVNIETGKESLVISGHSLPDPSDIVAAGLKKPLVTGSSSDDGFLVEVNPTTGKFSVVSKNGKFVFPSAMVLFGSNSALVVDPVGATQDGAIYEVNLNNGNQKTLVHGGQFTSPIGIGLLDDHTVAVTDIGPFSIPVGGRVYKVDLDTGDQTLLNGSDFSNPLGLGIAP